MNPVEQAQFVALLAAMVYAGEKTGVTAGSAVETAVAIYTEAVASVSQTPLPTPKAAERV